MKTIKLFIVTTLTLTSFTLSVYAASIGKSICGRQDDRRPSFEPKVGRAFESLVDGNASCTISMIGESCAITAGHCKNKLKYVEFNVPPSSNHRPKRAAKEDIYQVDKKTIVAKHNRRYDFAVFKLKPNKITGELAGQRQGYYQLFFKKPKKRERVVVTGYGTDLHRRHNMTQQSDGGTITDLNFLSSLIYHNADTMGGNSGSPIILKRNDQIVGVHTWGQCHSKGGRNVGTLVNNRKFEKAIKSCLRSENK